jgi:hypothetical protein
MPKIKFGMLDVCFFYLSGSVIMLIGEIQAE